MSDDAMERILGLVADGRLTPAEAATILDGLALGEDAVSRGSAEPGSQGSSSGGGSKASSDDSPARAIRIEVRESGRQVVNLRVPLALGRGALDRIPGLSESLTDRVREAIASGIKGSIVDVDEDDGGVRIIIE